MPQQHYTVETFEPINSIGFLIKRCGSLLTQMAEIRFESQPISFTQWLVLMKLRFPQHLSATQLSEQIGHDMGAMSRLVDSLERAGLVRRERSKEDRRAVEIALTPQGRKQLETSTHEVVEMVNETLDPFSKTEVSTMIAQLHRLMQRLQEQVEGSSAR